MSRLMMFLVILGGITAPLLAAEPSSRHMAATSQSTSGTLALNSMFGRLASTWNRIPSDIQRSDPSTKPTEAHEVSFYNPYSRKNEQAVVNEQRFQLKHAPVRHVEEMLRLMVTAGLGYIDADEAHAEISILDRPATVEAVVKAVAALDTPVPAVLYKVPFENVNAVQTLIRSHLTSKGKLTAVSSTVMIVSDNAEQLTMIDWLLRKSSLLFAPNALQARNAQWRTTPRTFGSFSQEKPLSSQTSYGGKVVTVEQRMYPVLYATPSIVMEAAQKIATRGLGRVDFDLEKNMLKLMDLPEVLARFETYMRVLDTEKPARLYVTPSKRLPQVIPLIQKSLSPKGEIIPFEKNGVIIVRDSEAELRRFDSLARMNFASSSASRPLPGNLPMRRIFPTSHPVASHPVEGTESTQP